MRSLATVLLVSAVAGLAAEPKPKYGAEVTLLSASHEYLRKRPAPDFWAIVPYYIGQQDERACSLASVTMLVNAARSSMKLTAEDQLATQAEVLKRSNLSFWQKGLAKGGQGATLDELKPILQASFAAYGVKVADVETVSITDTSPETCSRVERALEENEKSAKDFIIANFLQGTLTGDAYVGHVSPVAAYDGSAKRVLIMDTDRQWYEPYWVSLNAFVRSMATMDHVSGKNRGFVWVRLAD